MKLEEQKEVVEAEFQLLNKVDSQQINEVLLSCQNIGLFVQLER